MPAVFRPVTPSFLATLRACTWESPERLTLPTEPPTSLRVCVGESGAWALGKDPREPRTMSREVFEELWSAMPLDGYYVPITGGARALDDVDAGAALPGEIPPPPPPPR